MIVILETAVVIKVLEVVKSNFLREKRTKIIFQKQKRKTYQIFMKTINFSNDHNCNAWINLKGGMRILPNV